MKRQLRAVESTPGDVLITARTFDLPMWGACTSERANISSKAAFFRGVSSLEDGPQQGAWSPVGRRHVNPARVKTRQQLRVPLIYLLVRDAPPPRRLSAYGAHPWPSFAPRRSAAARGHPHSLTEDCRRKPRRPGRRLKLRAQADRVRLQGSRTHAEPRDEQSPRARTPCFRLH